MPMLLILFDVYLCRMCFEMNYFKLLKNVQPLQLINGIIIRNYAKNDGSSVSMLGGALKKKKLGKMGTAVEKKILPVETDPKKLVEYAIGINIYKTGEEVKLKPDSEYPDWLWNLRTGPPPPLEEMDPNSKQYWRRIRKMGMRRNNKLHSLRRF